MPSSNPTVPVPPVNDHVNSDRKRDALQALMTRLVDAREGLDAMLDRADWNVEGILRKIREDHHEAIGEVSTLLVAEGAEPDTEGSMMSTVNKAVVSIRAIFDDIDDDALERVVDGEQNVLDAFDDAEEVYRSGHAHDELVRMRQRLAGLLDEARRIAS